MKINFLIFIGLFYICITGMTGIKIVGNNDTEQTTNIPKVKFKPNNHLGIDPGSIVFDPTNWGRLGIMLENQVSMLTTLENQVEVQANMFKQLSKGVIPQDLVNILSNSLYNCGFSNLDFSANLSKYIPNLDLSNICSNANNIVKTGIKNLDNKFFKSTNNAVDNAKQLENRKEALNSLRSQATVLADLNLAQHKKKKDLLNELRKDGDVDTVLDALNIQNKILIEIANEQLEQTLMLSALVNLKTYGN